MDDGTPMAWQLAGGLLSTHHGYDQLRTWVISAKRQSGLVLALSWAGFSFPD